MLKQLLQAYVTCIAMLLLCVTPRAQETVRQKNDLLSLPEKLWSVMERKSDRLQSHIDRSTEKYLRQLQRTEMKLKRKMARKHADTSQFIFNDQEQFYRSAINHMKDSTERHPLQSDYNGHLDSMRTSIQFFSQYLSGDEKSSLATQPMHVVQSKLHAVQTKLNQSHAVQQMIARRKSELQVHLTRMGMTRELKKYKQQAFYYRAQVQEYKRMFSEPHLMEKKLLQIALKIPAFTKFFSKHSALGQIFRLPGGDDPPLSALQGLQTRAQIMEQMDNQFGSRQMASRAMQTGISDARSQMDQVRKNNASRNGGAESDMPNFKPNQQKTKSFLQRLELGSNIQSVRSNTFFPMTTDLGLSIGYKLTSSAVAGVGASYKVGWGKDVRHISVTHQGAGIRSFFDIRLKGGLWMSAGGEASYRSAFRQFEQLNNYSAWQKSALAGVSKKYQIKNKVKGNVQLLFDFLADRQVPRTQPIIIRFGYQLK